MHIAIVTHRLGTGEGQGRVNYEVAWAAARAGHNVTCVAHEVDLDLLAHSCIEQVVMPSSMKPLALLGNLIFARATQRWLQKHRNQFDVILSNGCNTWFTPDFSAVHFVHSAWRNSPVHGSRIESGPRAWYQWLYSTLNAALERLLLPSASAIIAVSAKVRDEVLDYELAGGPVHVVHNGVDLEEFAPGPVDREALGLPSDATLGLFAGGIRTPRKNLDSVLEAMQSVPAMHLAVLGATDGSPYPDLASKLGVDDRVHFLGFRHDVPDLMRAADFLAFPSRYEACSLVLLEALGAGLPIVTAATAGGAELVGAECGIVVDDPDDVEALASAFSLVCNDLSLRQRMSSASRRVAEAHSWQKMADRYLALFENKQLNGGTSSRRSPSIASPA